MNERIILHSDVNNFFASVECADKPELMDKPVAVAGNPEKRTGIILAKNEIAKKFGIKTGQTIFEAKQLCPDLICLPPHHDIYERISKQIHEIYLEYTDQVEPMGLDECWLDVTSSKNVINKTALEIANELRQRIKDEFKITVSIGISFSKVFAKLGSDMKKPDAVTIIPKNKFKFLTYHLPLNSIVGIGRRLEKKFTDMNVLTIGDFVKLDDFLLQKLTNKTCVELKHDLLGGSGERVKSYYCLEAPKSIGNGTTTIKDIMSRKEIEKVIHFLAEKVSSRLIQQHFHTHTISVSVKTNELRTFGHSRKISATNSSLVLSNEALSLLDSFWKYDLPIRAVRVKASDLEDISSSKQLSFFNIKKEKLAESVNKLTEKYGEKAVFIASETESYINRHTFDSEEKKSD